MFAGDNSVSKYSNSPVYFVCTMHTSIFHFWQHILYIYRHRALGLRTIFTQLILFSFLIVSSFFGRILTENDNYIGSEREKKYHLLVVYQFLYFWRKKIINDRQIYLWTYFLYTTDLKGETKKTFVVSFTCPVFLHTSINIETLYNYHYFLVNVISYYRHNC
jgi:hypothetical protein